MDKKGGISPFANKVYELARNIRLTAEHLDSVQHVVASLLSRTEDLPFLLQELDCTEEELFDAAMRFYKFKAEAEAIAQQAIECKNRAEALAKEILGDRYFGPFLGRDVVNPHKGVFSPEMLLTAGKVTARYIQKLRQKKGVK